MPDQDSEPENYSIDEMMDRLRGRGTGPRDGESELVTREDGTQVYKVRKRKRRSHQPKKEKEKRTRRNRVAQVVAAAAIVVVSCLALVGFMVYLNTSAYQKKLGGRVSEWTGAEVKFSRFHTTPVSAGVDGVELTWPESSVLKSLKLRGVRADLRPVSLLAGRWKGAEMSANSGQLVLGRPSGEPLAVTRSGDAPLQFRYRAPKFGVFFGDSSDPGVVRLVDSEATLDVPDAAATNANLRFEGGTLKIPGWGDFTVRFASLQIDQSGTRVGNFRLSSGARTSPSEIEVTNPEREPLLFDGGESRLVLRARRLPFSALLGQDSANWLVGEVETPEGAQDGSLVFSADPSDLSCRIPFRIVPGTNPVWKNVPMFSVISGVVGETWYQTPVFDFDAVGVLFRNGTSAGIENMRFSARNRLAVTGSAEISRSGELSGTLEVGLPEGVVNSSNAAFRTVFQRRDGAYGWATVTLSGTARQPQDDLQKQLDEAEVGTSPAAGGDPALDEAFEELFTPER